MIALIIIVGIVMFISIFGLIFELTRKKEKKTDCFENIPKPEIKKFHSEYKHIFGEVIKPLNEWEKQNLISFKYQFPNLNEELILRTQPNPAYNSHVFYYEGKFISENIIRCGETVEYHHSYFTHWMYKKTLNKK